jgi:hypothetical protein
MNPYRDRPAHTYWKNAMTDHAGSGVDPVVSVPFLIGPRTAVATAGSCFAQHISRTLVAQGFRYLVTETYHGDDGAVDENYGVFPARFGNLYTSRQLLQLFHEAYGLRQPDVDNWIGKDGEVIDPFRPRIQAGGFRSVELLRADRERHLRAVRRMFERCEVFIFTLGLTETWLMPDGSALPLAPGVVTGQDWGSHFHNFCAAEVTADLEMFLEGFSEINPRAKVILTVSPVSLIATFEDRHVLVSTIASKSILRAAADDVCRRHGHVAYFPSYEIIVGPQTAAQYYAPDLREVTREGVSYVMSVFSRHYLATNASAPPPERPAAAAAELSDQDRARLEILAAVVCDEEAMVH